MLLFGETLVILLFLILFILLLLLIILLLLKSLKLSFKCALVIFFIRDALGFLFCILVCIWFKSFKIKLLLLILFLKLLFFLMKFPFLLFLLL